MGEPRGRIESRWISVDGMRLADRIETKLPRMRMPTLVVRGEYDPIVPHRRAEEATRMLLRGRLAVLPGAPHAANFDAPDELAEVVLDFPGTVDRR